MTAYSNKPTIKDDDAVVFLLGIADIPLRQAVARVLAWDGWGQKRNMDKTFAIGNPFQNPKAQEYPKRSEIVAKLIEAGYTEYVAEARVHSDYDTMLLGMEAEAL